MDEVRYDVVKKYGVVAVRKGGWTLELNLVSWNGYKPKLDLREWSPDGQKMGKGVTLTLDEADQLIELLQKALPQERELDDGE